MRWPWQGSDDSSKAAAASASSIASSPPSSPSTPPSGLAQYPPFKQLSNWTNTVRQPGAWQHYQDPQAWVPPAVAVAAALGFSAFYRAYLRRIPTTNHILPRYYRRRSLYGKVTSVGDGDNFHFYHTPGGRMAGWGWIRKVPSYRKELRGNTIPVRIAGIDAPEGAHFGRPAQPYSGEALDFLTHYLLGRRVRVYLYRRDQYDRVVARVTVRRFLFFRRDVGIQMLKRGLATCYEAKTGVEFGGREAQYRVAEARAKARKRGLWSGGSNTGDVETPREYKTRMAALGSETSSSAAEPSFAAMGSPDKKTASPVAPAASSTPSSSSSTSPAPPPPSSPSSGASSGASAAASASAATSAAKQSSTSSPGASQPGGKGWGKGPGMGAKR